jgi:hypothetical protein
MANLEHLPNDGQVLRMTATGHKRTNITAEAMSASLIGHSGSSTFRLPTCAVSTSLAGSRFSSESAPGPSIMGFEDKVEQSLARPCREMNGRPSGHTNSPHPSSREGHHSTIGGYQVSPICFDPLWLSGCGDLPGPSEFGAVNPDAVHDHGQSARQGHDRLFQPAVPGNLHRPGLEPGPFRRAHQ